MENIERVALGSGKLYSVDYNATTGVPADDVLETDANKVGYTSGGASLEYKPTIKDTVDDEGEIIRSDVTEEEATLKFAVLTWNAGAIAEFCPNAEMETETDTSGSSSTVVGHSIGIGGKANYSDKVKVYRFVHTDKSGRIERMTIIGQNRTGMTVSYKKDEAQSHNVEIKATKYITVGTKKRLCTFSETEADA